MPGQHATTGPATQLHAPVYQPGMPQQAQGRVLRSRRINAAVLRSQKQEDKRNSKLTNQAYDRIKAFEEWLMDIDRPIMLTMPILFGLVIAFMILLGAVLFALGWLGYVLFLSQPETKVKLDVAEWSCTNRQGDTCHQWTKR